MTIRTRIVDVIREPADLLVVGAYQGAKRPAGALAVLDKALTGSLTLAMEEDGFKGAAGETYLCRPTGIKAKRILVVGLGAKNKVTEETIRQAAAMVANTRVRADRVVCMLLGEGSGIAARPAAKAMVEGFRLAFYRFGRYKKEEERAEPKQVDIGVSDRATERAANEGAAMGELYARATIIARDLVNTPGQHMSPAHLVQEAKAAVKGSKSIKMKVYGRAELEKMGAGGILGIAQGSDHEPFLVHMTYTPTKRAKKSVAIVGKAITFDSGGLSLKPAEAMTNMKIDMAGGADVIGVFAALAELKPHVTVHGLFAACENMPSGTAIRPGDVVQTINGKTIEVLNTDAEGRVTLADVLAYAVQQKPDMIVDLATLTGACMVALGEEVTGLMSNNHTLTKALLDASEAAGEKMWELPLEEAYRPLIKSDVADYKNIAGRYGGAITAGLLLEEFVAGTPWAHLDIAGPSFAERPMGAYSKKGATGHGVRTLLEWLRAF